MLPHFGKHRFDVRKPERFLSRSLQFFESVELPHRDDVALNLVWFVEIGERVFDKGVSDSGGKV
jgi:hypothetical protein